MAKVGGLEPFETVATGSSPDSSVPLDPEPRRAAGRCLSVAVTPMGAFAAGALVVASLALAWTLGRRAAPQRAPRAIAPANSLDDVRRLPPIPYNELPVDQGFAD